MGLRPQNAGGDAESLAWAQHDSGASKEADVFELARWLTTVAPRSVSDLKPLVTLMQALLRDLLAGRVRFFSQELLEAQVDLAKAHGDVEGAVKALEAAVKANEATASARDAQAAKALAARLQGAVSSLKHVANTSKGAADVQRLKATLAERDAHQSREREEAAKAVDRLQEVEHALAEASASAANCRAQLASKTEEIEKLKAQLADANAKVEAAQSAKAAAGAEARQPNWMRWGMSEEHAMAEPDKGSLAERMATLSIGEAAQELVSALPEDAASALSWLPKELVAGILASMDDAYDVGEVAAHLSPTTAAAAVVMLPDQDARAAAVAAMCAEATDGASGALLALADATVDDFDAILEGAVAFEAQRAASANEGASAAAARAAAARAVSPSPARDSDASAAASPSPTLGASPTRRRSLDSVDVNQFSDEEDGDAVPALGRRSLSSRLDSSADEPSAVVQAQAAVAPLRTLRSELRVMTDSICSVCDATAVPTVPTSVLDALAACPARGAAELLTRESGTVATAVLDALARRGDAMSFATAAAVLTFASHKTGMRACVARPTPALFPMDAVRKFAAAMGESRDEDALYSRIAEFADALALEGVRMRFCMDPQGDDKKELVDVAGPSAAELAGSDQGGFALSVQELASFESESAGRLGSVVVVPLMVRAQVWGVASVDTGGVMRVTAQDAASMAAVVEEGLEVASTRWEKALSTVKKLLIDWLGDSDGQLQRIALSDDASPVVQALHYWRSRQRNKLLSSSMERQLAEVKRYRDPPKPVISTVCAVLLLVGVDVRRHLTAELQVPGNTSTLWRDVQRKFVVDRAKKNWVLRLMKAAKVGGAGTLQAANLKAAAGLLQSLTAGEVKKSSKAVVCLHTWATSFLLTRDLQKLLNEKQATSK